MRMLYHHRTQGTGVEAVHILGMARGFEECDFKVEIVGPPSINMVERNTNTDNSSQKSSLRKLLYFYSERAPEMMFELAEVLYNLYAYANLKKIIKTFQPELFYERYALNTFVLTYINRKLRFPLILEVNDATVIERSRPLALEGMTRRIEKEIFLNATLLVTITNHFKELICHSYKIPEQKVLVLPNAVDPERFVIKPENRLNKEQLDISASMVIGVVGAFVPWHGLDFLIKSVHKLVREMDVHILLVGDGPVKSDILRMADSYNIKDRVRFTGFVSPDEIPYYIDLLDICLIPGSNEHCSPMKLFEYMAMGRPVLIPDFPVLLEVGTHGQDAFFFKQGDSADFRHKLGMLLEDSDLRKRLGDNAKNKVLEEYTWTQNAEKVINTLREQNKL